GPYLERMCAAGADVISLGKRHDLAAARAAYPELVFQGNVDEDVLSGGTREQVIAATRACVRAGGGRRHIVNLNHGVGRSTAVGNFEGCGRRGRGGIWTARAEQGGKGVIFWEEGGGGGPFGPAREPGSGVRNRVPYSRGDVPPRR